MRARSMFDRDADGGSAVSMLPPSTGTQNGLPVFDWNEVAVQLNRGGQSWTTSLGQPVTISYAYRSTGTPPADADVFDFARFNAAQIAVTEEALRLWSDVANITFDRVGAGTTGEGAYSNNATMLFGGFMDGPTQFTAFAYLPDPEAMDAGSAEGDLWFNLARNYMNDPISFPLGAQIIAHEIGHTLGLLHPSQYGGGAQSGPQYEVDADYWQDTHMFTLMSYFSETFTGASWGTRPVGPQLHDIAAAQRLYGVNTTTRTGDTVYGFNGNTGHASMTITSSTQAVVFAIWDAGGNDTLDLSGYAFDALIDLREEAFSSAGQGAGQGLRANYNIAIAKGAIIENAIGGSGDDDVMGNGVANRLVGRNGDNSLNGAAGSDLLIGGRGRDELNGGGANDTASYGDSATRVRINLNASTALDGSAHGDTLISIENLIGSAFNDILTGTSGINDLRGGAGDDSLSGLGGHDLLTGNGGADTFVFRAGQGVDVIADFGVGQDKIALENSSFRGIGLEGALTAGRFYVGAAAHDANDRIVYNSATGGLFYDADGNGAGAAVRFATLSPELSLSASDIIVV